MSPMRSFIVLTLLLPFIGYAQTDMELESFDEITVTGNIEVKLELDTRERLTLETKNIPEDKVTVRVSRGVLRISVLESVFYKDETIRVQVSFKQLRAVRGNSGAFIEGLDEIETDELKVRANTGSKLGLRIRVNSLDAGASEGGIFTAVGEAERQEINVATGGQYEGLELECRRTYVKANTGGQAEVVANEFLEAAANTGASVRYTGEPSEVNSKTFLSGEVEKM